MSDSRHSEGHRGRLRQRFLKAGFDAFAPHEIIELLLTLAIPRRDVKPIAYALLGRFGSLRGILEAPAEQLCEVEGVGDSSVFALGFLKNLVPHLMEQDLGVVPLTARCGFLSDLWRYRIGASPTEVFEVAHFDSGFRLHPQGIITHSSGGEDRAAVFVKEIITQALQRKAYAIAFAHNHPSGDPKPSDADKLITKQLVLAGAASQIKVIDHYIVTRDHAFSFKSEGLL